MVLRIVLVVSSTTRGADDILVSSVSPVDKDSWIGEDIIEAVLDSDIEGEAEEEFDSEGDADVRLVFERVWYVDKDLMEFLEDKDLDGEELLLCE